MSDSSLENAWWIDCKDNSTGAGAPHHLQDRLGNRLGTVKSTRETAEEKREKLLQERRRRLALSFQHVCEVRLSHQESQQRYRKRFRSDLEYRIALAAACREKRLRGLALFCGQEVRRAKSVASHTKRRMLVNTEACAFVQHQAARKIQHWWRSVYVRSVLTTCSKSFPAQLLRMRPPSQFSAMQRLIMSRAALKPSQNLLDRLSKVNAVFTNIRSPRVFLSAFAISHFPKMVLGNNGCMEMELKVLATALVHCFRLFVRGCHYNTDAFALLWQQYNLAFDAWKNADRQRLIAELVGFWQQAEQLKHSILGSRPGTDAQLEVVQDIERRQQKLEQDLRRLGGEDAVRALHSQQSLSVSSDRKDHGEHSFCVREVGQTAPAAQEDAKDGFEEEVQGTVEKMVLAHELAVNDSFKLERHKLKEGSLEQHVTECVHRAFWDSLKQQLESNPPNYTQALSLLEEVKHALLQLIPPLQSVIQQEVNEVLDVDLICQQAAHGILDIGGYADFIVSILLRLCAPSRDGDVQSILSYKDDVVKLFKNMFRVLEQMKLDLANFQLQMLKPHLHATSVEYEREKFQQLLESKHSDLSATRSWLMKAVAEKCGGLQQQVDKKQIMSLALAKLLFWTDEEDYPETWHLDVHRLQNLQFELHCLAALCACVTVAASSPLGQPLKTDKVLLEQLKNDLWCVISGSRHRGLRDVAANVAEQLKAILLQWRRNHQLPLPCATDVSSLFQLVEMTLSAPQHPVLQLLLSRLRLMVEEAVYMNVKVSDVHTPPGLLLCSTEVLGVVTAFLHLVQRNRQVFGPTYSALLEDTTK